MYLWKLRFGFGKGNGRIREKELYGVDYSSRSLGRIPFLLLCLCLWGLNRSHPNTQKGACAAPYSSYICSVNSFSVLFWVVAKACSWVKFGKPYNHCFTRVQWAWIRDLHLRSSLFCRNKHSCWTKSNLLLVLNKMREENEVVRANEW